ncbi:MAG: hypothetical protein WD874_01715, partial [Parcubacteria group bacterium]
MANKVSFDATNKIIQITQAPVDGIVDLDVKIDIYSDGKEDWLSNSTLNKYKFPVAAIGGNALPGSKTLGSTFFLLYGWKIRPYEADHTLNINGNLYSEDGSTPFSPTVGTFNVAIVSSVSSLVDANAQTATAIAVWNALVASHLTDGTTGKKLYDAGGAGNPWSSTITGNTDAGTF